MVTPPEAVTSPVAVIFPDPSSRVLLKLSMTLLEYTVSATLPMPFALWLLASTPKMGTLLWEEDALPPIPRPE